MELFIEEEKRQGTPPKEAKRMAKEVIHNLRIDRKQSGW